MTIKFTKAETNAYPFIGEISVGMEVLALKDCDYEGLKGTISEIQYGNDKETENETVLDIHVDFEEHEHAPTEKTHPHLNGTGISGVICGEDELGFKFDYRIPFFQTAEGLAVCPHCHDVLRIVKETQTTGVTWTFKDGQYMKGHVEVQSDGKRCEQCDGLIEDENQKVFSN